MGLGFECAGLAASAEQARDEGVTDAEPAGDLPERTVAVIDRGGDALSEVHGIGFHPAPPLQLAPFLHFTVVAIQQRIALVPLTANRGGKSYAASVNGFASSTRHFAMTLATDFEVQWNGWATSFHSLMKATSRSASRSLSAKSAIRNRFRFRMPNHCSTWFIHEQ